MLIEWNLRQKKENFFWIRFFFEKKKHLSFIYLFAFQDSYIISTKPRMMDEEREKKKEKSRIWIERMKALMNWNPNLLKNRTKRESQSLWVLIANLKIIKRRKGDVEVDEACWERCWRDTQLESQSIRYDVRTHSLSISGLHLILINLQ